MTDALPQHPPQPVPPTPTGYPRPDPGALKLRLETPFDDSWIEALHEVAFGPGRFARAAFRVRERYATDSTLNWVGEMDGVRAASVRMTPIRVGDHDGYLLGPLMTDPAFRNRGVGRSLVDHVCALALERDGVDFVMLVGDRAYYMPLGFEPTTLRAVTFPGPVDPERVLAITRTPDLAPRLAGPVSRFGGVPPTPAV